jgi:hypothetical protein
MAKRLPLAGLLVMPATEQLSEAAGVGKVTTAPAGEVASITMLPGQLMAGGVVSTTVTVATALFDKPWRSVTVSVTLVLPSGYGPGGDWAMVMVAPALGEYEPLLMEASARQLEIADTVTGLH